LLLISRAGFAQWLRQLSEVHRNPSRLILREQLRRRSSPRLFLEINVRQLLPVSVLYDEASIEFFNSTRLVGSGEMPSDNELAALIKKCPQTATGRRKERILTRLQIKLLR
jgi:hypothetical protein